MHLGSGLPGFPGYLCFGVTYALIWFTVRSARLPRLPVLWSLLMDLQSGLPGFPGYLCFGCYLWIYSQVCQATWALAVTYAFTVWSARLPRLPVLWSLFMSSPPGFPGYLTYGSTVRSAGLPRLPVLRLLLMYLGSCLPG